MYISEVGFDVIYLFFSGWAYALDPYIQYKWYNTTL